MLLGSVTMPASLSSSVQLNSGGGGGEALGCLDDDPGACIGIESSIDVRVGDKLARATRERTVELQGERREGSCRDRDGVAERVVLRPHAAILDRSATVGDDE